MPKLSNLCVKTSTIAESNIPRFQTADLLPNLEHSHRFRLSKITDGREVVHGDRLNMCEDCVWLSSDSVICDSDTGDATAHHDHHATRSQDKLTVTRCSTFQEEGTLSPAQKHIPDSGRGSAKVQNRHTGEYD